MLDQRARWVERKVDRLLVHLVRAQMLLHTYGMQTLPAGADDRWPSRLIAGGTVLAGTSAVLCGTWLHKRL